MAMRRNGSSGLGLAPLLIAALAISAPTHASADPLTRFLDGIFKKEQPQAQPAPTRAAPRQRSRPATKARQVPRKPQPATVIVRDAQQRREANTFIAVIGDSLAESLVEGLREAFAATSEIAVVNRASAGTGLARATEQDWEFLTRDYTRDGMPNPQAITLGVVFFGADSKPSVVDGAGELVPFGAPRWQELMAERIDAAVRAFADRGVPLVWVGPPPMKAEAHNDIAAALNALYRDEVVKAGGVFVDIWAAFSNEDKGFIASGPDVKGQDARLRAADGVGLTRSGARKVAHFTEVEIRRLLQARGVSAVIATTAETSSDSDENRADRAGTLLSLPDMPVPVVIPVKPVAGPILPLLAIQPTPDGTLLQSRPLAKGDAAALIHQVYGEGRAPEPVAGRADDFSWPADTTRPGDVAGRSTDAPAGPTAPPAAVAARNTP
ncbi:SGNH/GDSL hydrolase family protein [Pseudochelatococcus sp. B33]